MLDLLRSNFHIEPSTKCNARCYTCWTDRSINEDIDVEALKRFLHKDILKNTESVVFCGSHGDPIFHPQFLDLVSHFSSFGHIDLRINTNGSIHKAEWWEKLARVLNKSSDIVYFSIDGLEDTHHIYRTTNYERVVENMTAFIEAGGNAFWQFLVFKHNQHQVDEARERAAKLNTVGFRLMESRLYTKELEKPTITFDTAEPPISFLERSEEQKKKHTKGEDFCTYKDSEVYIGADGIVVPCHYYSTSKKEVYDKTWYKGLEGYKYLAYINKYMDKLDMTENSLEEIINSEYFKWFNCNMKSSPLCQAFCGINYD